MPDDRRSGCLHIGKKGKNSGNRCRSQQRHQSKGSEANGFRLPDFNPSSGNFSAGTVVPRPTATGKADPGVVILIGPTSIPPPGQNPSIVPIRSNNSAITSVSVKLFHLYWIHALRRRGLADGSLRARKKRRSLQWYVFVGMISFRPRSIGANVHPYPQPR
ncbi:MAG: hypothetical protein V7642_2511 [Burkholderiales bacterium]|jgi:hypothetical protein